MNNSQLRRIGVPDFCIKSALAAVQVLAKQRGVRGGAMKKQMRAVLAAPEDFVEDVDLGEFARDIIEDREFTRPEPIEYRTWGSDIDAGAHHQMQQSCSLPMAVGGALMPDAHIGYGLPIGGVLALDNAVVPYAVGVDIACRMKLSVLDLPVAALDEEFHRCKHALEGGTRFGVGSTHQRPQQHDVMDEDWTVSRVTRENKDKAWRQLGTSGSGNHFVEFGVFTLDVRDEELGLDAGEYVALLSHSGSRGAGASVCNVYSSIARKRLPKRYEDVQRLAWLDMDSEAGQEYWAAMNLMGDYAAANHAVIHRLVSDLLGAAVIAGVENHHNFAWKEMHGGKELIVHRKGATPAGAGVLGVIPGSMADPAYVVRGKGNPASLDSASHGAGRRMSRTQAKDTYNFKAVKKDLATKGITILSAGADEVPGVYKNIDAVMSEQQDLVDIVARFDPKIVKMCGDGSRAED
ncbi:RNA-splicing ligase RtcB [Symmachiella dynata]|uniref:RtcB family protein n=1 Tax=Symmachiella dynata TaxID=2527995 RepID=UPI001189A429|nr:RtcB family protein [Symmachiella dynata]QDT46926.1 RNA-splicing ligase RtcB [Symmachiella dynata]